MKKNNNSTPMGIFNNRYNDVTSTIDYKLWLQRILKKLVISIGLFLIILAIASINTRPTNFITRQIGCITTKNFNAVESYNKIKTIAKEIGMKSNEALMVMNLGNWQELKLISPKEGNIILGFNEEIAGTSSLSKGIIIEGEEGKNVVAVEDGVVVELGMNDAIGKYIIIKHRGELLSVYKSLEKNLVDKNQKVSKGELIGNSSGRLQFEIWHKKEPVNPFQFIDMNIKSM